MGDRTTVTLTVLKEQADKVEQIIEDFDDASDHGVFVDYIFYEVNYGSLQYLDMLQAEGIAFDSHWEHGGDYGPGTDYCRFLSDGTVWRDDISDSYVNPSLAKCMELINKPDELKEYICQHFNDVSPPSWDHQIEYGKLYKARQLINPD